MAEVSALAVQTGAGIALADAFPVLDISDTSQGAGGTLKQITLAELEAAFGIYAKALASDDAKSSTTAAEVLNLSITLPAGTYFFRYAILYRTAATTTGAKFSVNFTGTVTSFVANQRWIDVATSATAAQTRAPSQNTAAGTTGQLMAGVSARAVSTAGWGTSISVDAANSDMLMIIEGILVCSTSGDIELWAGTEVAASNATVRTGTNLVVQKF